MDDNNTSQEDYVYNMWLEWFFCNADFGPAHDDVMIGMFEDFQNETGEFLPSDVTEGWL